MKKFRVPSAIGFCLTFLFVLNVGVLIAMVITGDHLLAAYAIGLSGYQCYLHHKFAPRKKGLQLSNQRPLRQMQDRSIKNL